MSASDMAKHAMKVCRVIEAVADRGQVKFEANLVRMICYLIGKIDMTDEHIKRICAKVPFVSAGNVDISVRQAIIDAMGRHDVVGWPK